MDFSLIIELAINGALIGLMYALVALGIVLITRPRASQISLRARLR